LTERFSPTVEEYQAVLEFVPTNRLSAVATNGGRRLLDVAGSVADIQRAFRLTLRTYRHPLEARELFAPDAEPSVETRLPTADISGLSNYPH
jgi:hypothetical protein